MKLPTLTKDQAIEFCRNHFPQVTNALIVFGIRGYFDPGANKRGIYDDAIGYISDSAYGVFPANCDPSIVRPEIAVLQPGVWLYSEGLHGLHHITNSKEDQARLVQLQKTRMDIPGYTACYWALRQSGDVTVVRDGHKEPYTDTPPRPRMWIDIHRGGYNTTSSEGCQTIHPDYWDAFYWKGIVSHMLKVDVVIPYCLADAQMPIQ